MFKKLKVSLVIASSITLSGCLGMGAYNNRAISGNIVEDAVRSNEVYAEATNAIILKNILRAKDRWPRSFTTISGITTRPTSAFSLGPSLAPRSGDLGQLPFALTPGTLGRNTNTVKEYKVNPFAENGRTESLLTQIDESTFERYFDFWKSDLALLLLVKEWEPKDTSQSCTLSSQSCRTFEAFTNPGDDYCAFEDALVDALALPHSVVYNTRTGQNVQATCQIRREIERVDPYYAAQLNPINLENFELVDPKASKATNLDQKSCASDTLSVDDMMGGSALSQRMENLKAFAELTGAKVKMTSNDSASQMDVKVCNPGSSTKVLRYKGNPNVEFAITRRSFEDIIYYLGETLRYEGSKPRVSVPCGAIEGPVFDITLTPRDVPYAAKVKHAGYTFYSMPADETPCDRTTTVMSMLTELLVLNQSAEFLKAPDIINR